MDDGGGWIKREYEELTVELFSHYTQTERAKTVEPALSVPILKFSGIL